MSTKSLRFSGEDINRYSLDHLPRSLSIRQGNMWFGYDLERAKIYKAWRSPPGKSGAQGKGFVVRSVGDTLFEDKTESTWRLQRAGREIPLRIRYLGVSERGSGDDKHYLLNWELRHDAGHIELTEKVSVHAPVKDAPTRFVRMTALPAGDTLVAPGGGTGSWQLSDAVDLAGAGKPGNVGEHWQRLTLDSTSSTPRK